MTKQVYSPLNLNNETLSKVNLPTYTSLPTIESEGSVIFNSTDEKIYISDGTSWNELKSGDEPYVSILSDRDLPDTGTGTNIVLVGPNNKVSEKDPGSFIDPVFDKSDTLNLVGSDILVKDSHHVNIFGEDNSSESISRTIILGDKNSITGAESGFGYGTPNMLNNILLGNENNISDIELQEDLGGRIQIGHKNLNDGAFSSNTIQLGNSTGIGYDSKNSIALGFEAEIGSAAENAVQILKGTNNTPRTLQFLDNIIADENGLVGVNNNGGGGSGEPYVVIDSTGNIPTLTGNNTNAVLLGVDTEAQGSISGVAIGARSFTGAIESTAVGADTFADGVESVALGSNARALQVESMALGHDAIATASNAVQIGAGTNSFGTTLQFRNRRIANNEGLYTPFVNPNSYSPTDTDSVTSHLQAIDEFVAENKYIAINSISTEIASITNSADGIAIGRNSKVYTECDESIAFGKDAEVGGTTTLTMQTTYTTTSTTVSGATNTSTITTTTSTTTNIAALEALAIGKGALGRAEKAVQIGQGSNTEQSTIQYLTSKIADKNGIRILETTGVPSITSPVVGSCRFDSANNSLYIYNGTTWVSTTLS